ncbi:MAG: transglutaminase domain-containing protein [Cyclobacteriaceae bacterium]|nr:transglutaminase domain-containing protein [Cyclobacteriaceae bacterium]
MQHAGRFLSKTIVALSIVLSFLTLNCYGQKISEVAVQEAAGLKKMFDKDEIAAVRSVVSYEYFITPAGYLQAREKNKNQYITLKPNSTLVLRNYSNNHVSIESYSIKTEKDRSQPHDKYCGSSVSDDIFYSDGQMCAYRTNLNQVGQGVNYESSILYKDPKYVTQVFFHEETPSKWREMSFVVPNGVDLEFVERNFANYKIEKKVTPSAKGKVYTYTIQNLEAMPKEENQPGYLHFIPHVLILCKSYQSPKGERVAVLSSTQDLYKWYASLTAQLNTNYDAIKPMVQDLTKNLKTDEEKIRAIYYWVQDNIKYIAFEDGIAAFKPEDASEVFYKRYGDCKGMANLTKAMLTIAGYDARLTWIGTNKIPYTYNLPTLAVDNHMICTVMLKDKQLILDATEKQNAMGEHAERIQGKEILIENGANYVLSKVPEEPIDLYLEDAIWQFSITDNVLKGTGVTSLNGETKKNILYYWSTMKIDDRVNFMKRYLSGKANPDEFDKPVVSGLKRDSVMTIRCGVSLNNQLYKNNQELYVDLDFEDDFANSQLKKDRKVPYKFSSRSNKKVRMELTIPTGYQLSYLPEPLTIKNSHYEFDMSYQLVGNKIIYTRQIKILKNTLPTSEFEKWNSTIQEVKGFYNNQITLKQK